MDEGVLNLSLGELVTALQLGDSFFPSGRYTLSHGLESFVEESKHLEVAQLGVLFGDYLRHAVGNSEAVAVATVNRAVRNDDIETIIDVDCRLLALKLPSEAQMASTRSGKQVLDTVGHLVDDPMIASYELAVAEGEAPGNHAVVIGMISALWGLQPDQAAAMELHAYLTGLLGAALRLVRMDHIDAQLVLKNLGDVVVTTAALATQLDYRDMSAFAPMIEVMQMKHEHSHLRLFAS